MGIDVGTTRVKGVRVAADGTIVQAVAHPCPPTRLHGGFVVQDVDGVVASAEAVRDALVVDGVVAIGLACQRDTTVFRDAEARPVLPAVSWLDRDPGDRRARLGPLADAVVDAPSLAAVLAERWTGRCVDTPATGGRSDAPRVEVGTILDAPLPVVLAGGDKNCELLGCGVTGPGRVAGSFGTALSVGTCVPVGAPTPEGAFTSVASVPGTVQVEVGLPAGGSMRPVLRRWLAADPSTWVLPDESGPLCLPFFGGSLFHPDATGAWVGLTPEVSAGVLGGAWVEGLVLELARGLDAVARVQPLEGDLVLAGGGATPRFAAWLADGLGRTVRLAADHPHGALGAAAVARVSMGFAPDLEAAVARGPHARRSFDPDPSSAGRWARRRAVFEATAERLFRVSG